MSRPARRRTDRIDAAVDARVAEQTSAVFAGVADHAARLHGALSGVAAGAVSASVETAIAAHHCGQLGRRIDEVSADTGALRAAAAEVLASVDDISPAAELSARAAAQASEMAVGASAIVVRLGAASDGISDVAAFVGGVASLTELLSLNVGIESVVALDAEVDGVVTPPQAAAADIQNLVRDTVRAASVIADRIGVIREDSAGLLRALVSIGALAADLAARQAAITAAVATHAETAARLTRRIEEVEAVVAEMSGECATATVVTLRCAEQTMAVAGAMEPIIDLAGRLCAQAAERVRPA